MMKIDEQILIDNSWYFYNKENIPGFGEFCYYKLDYDKFHMTITFGMSNSGREACLHIDNQDFETIGSIDIDTVEQFNMMMKIIECDYEIN